MTPKGGNMLTRWNTMYPFQVKGRVNFFIRAEIAKKIFKSSHDKRGIHIPITFDERDELYEIEGGPNAKFYKNQSIMIARVKEILNKNINERKN
jgi:hypothetical protein